MIKGDTKFLDEYFDDFKKIINFNSDEIKKKLINLKKIFITIKKNKKKNTNFWKWWKCSNCKSFQYRFNKKCKNKMY